MTSFSNPNPDLGASAAVLQARAPEANAPNISGLIAAMLEDNYRKQQMQQQLADRVTKAVGDIRQSHDAGQLADYIQNHDPNLNATDISGTEGASGPLRLKMLQIAQQQHDQESPQTYQDSSGINYVLGPQGWHAITNAAGDVPMTYTDGNGIHYVRGAKGWNAINRGATGEMTPRQDVITNNESAKFIKQGIQSRFGMSPDEFGNVTHGDFDAQGNWVPNEQGKSGMIGKPIVAYHDPGSQGVPSLAGIPIVGGLFSGRKPSDTYDYQNVYPRQTADEGSAGVAQYKKLLSNPTAKPTGVNGSGMSAEDARALDWAQKNPNDPYAQKILSLHGG